jgi:hypothetical protein
MWKIGLPHESWMRRMSQTWRIRWLSAVSGPAAPHHSAYAGLPGHPYTKKWINYSALTLNITTSANIILHFARSRTEYILARKQSDMNMLTDHSRNKPNGIISCSFCMSWFYNIKWINNTFFATPHYRYLEINPCEPVLKFYIYNSYWTVYW